MKNQRLATTRCGHCGQRARGLEADATGTLACFACYVPDTTQPKYRGATEDFIVAPPSAKDVIGRVLR